MIGNTWWDYVFIRSCIFFLHYITPLSILSCISLVLLRAKPYRVHWVIETFVHTETAFYCLVYLPLKKHVQRPATHPGLRSRAGRRELFQQCSGTIPDLKRYLSKWFLDAPIGEIKRENLKVFFRWAFLNTAIEDSMDDNELEEYIVHSEKLLGQPIEPGLGQARCLRLTLDDVDVLHRSLTWYICVFVVDTITCTSMLWHSFRFYRPSPLHAFSSFPPRPVALLSDKSSPTETLTYWHRPHTAKNKLPVVFIHGIGIGLYPYVNFLAELNGGRDSLQSNGQVGIIAIELTCVSFRITHQALAKEDICKEVRLILERHGFQKFVLATHSYGSIIATHLLRDNHISPRIGPVLFIDPVSFLLHLPDVAYNFTYRKPVTAPEYQLHYFASKDTGVLHTLCRRFFWSESILWKEDLAGKRATVVLSGRDLIVDTEAVGRYLTLGSAKEKTDDWKSKPWTGEGLEVLWFQELDHMQVLDAKSDRKTLVDVVRRYCEVIV